MFRASSRTAGRDEHQWLAQVVIESRVIFISAQTEKVKKRRAARRRGVRAGCGRMWALLLPTRCSIYIGNICVYEALAFQHQPPL